MKITVIIPVHTHRHVAELTIGTLLKHHSGHDLNIHVGVHSNYADYTSDIRLFEDLRGIAQIHLVDEIDWLGQYNTCVYRYSVMHAKNIVNLMKHVRYYDFDYLVLLDNDLYFKGDLISELTKNGADLAGSIFEDRDTLWEFETKDKIKMMCLPKVSVWHLAMSRRLFDAVMAKPDMVYPKAVHGAETAKYDGGSALQLPLFIDTFAEVLFNSRRDGFRVDARKSEDLSKLVDHFFVSSFNYGMRTLKDQYGQHVSRIINIFNKEFPSGLSPFRR